MYDEERIGELLRAMPQVPEAWVQTAARLPATRRAIEQIAALAEVDAGFRQDALRDLEGALQRAGLEPSPALVEHLRDRL
ncbi:MAG TPA: hypothetical protein VFH74_08660 [Gaiellales bacterium]|jgi:hypothetical protein|nr:hypothetical protein [Gaiellales bacterium]